MGTLRHRMLGGLAAVGLVAAPLALGAATAAGAAPVSAASTATVANGAELREQWATASNTVITLTANIDLGDDGSGGSACGSGEPVRSSSGSGTITVDGQGLYSVTQTCKGQRVLRDEASGERVVLTGITDFTGGNADGHGGGLRTEGPVDVINSTISGNTANASFDSCSTSVACGAPDAEVACDYSSADAQTADYCEDGDGGGIYTASYEYDSADVVAGYDITLTDSFIVNNTAADDGGGVYTSDTLTATRTTFESNTALGEAYDGGRGGGAYAEDGATLTGSTFTTNEALCGVWIAESCRAAADGGGVHTYSEAIVDSSTFTGNHAYDSGGGVYAADGATVTGSTFTGNQAGGESEEAAAAQAPDVLRNMVHATDSGSANCECSGGGVYTTGAAEITGSTFVSNGAGCNESCLAAGGAVAAFGNLTVSGSTFGDAADPEPNSNAAGCFFGCGALGGALFASGSVAVTGSTFVLNGNGCIAECNALGGAIYQGSAFAGGSLGERVPAAVRDQVSAQVSDPSTLTVDTSHFWLNEAGCFSPYCFGAGGAIWVDDAETVAVTASTFDTNDALFNGGAIAVNSLYNLGDDSVTCAATCGGTDVTVVNSTVTGNQSGLPAAISVPSESDSLTLVHDTIDGNVIEERQFEEPEPVAPEAGVSCECLAAAVFAGNLQSFGTDITHSGFVPVEVSAAAPPSVENCWAETDSLGYNYSDDDSCGFTDPTDNQAEGNDPLLGALGDNGGPTPTMLPTIGASPLIDAIPIADCDPEVPADQRGVSRPQALGCDIGAVEVKAGSVQVTKDVTGLGGATTLPFAGPYVFDVECSDGTSATLEVADPFGGTSAPLEGIVPGSTCTVVEESIVIVGIPVAVTYSPAGVDSAGITLDGEDTVNVGVTNDFAEILAVLGAIANIQPRFTG